MSIITDKKFMATPQREACSGIVKPMFFPNSGIPVCLQFAEIARTIKAAGLSAALIVKMTFGGGN
ncbi:MAG: hypothetical protein LBH00_00490 [Planctomycetaceae bacterium]|jgi:hypothetical protein|nr:hypothetical protein [Planctomycetaceae bacterium]